MSTKFISKHELLFFAIFLPALFLVYSNHFHNGFHFDDSHTIESNVFIQNIKNIPKFFTDATTTSSLPLNQAYRPVVTSMNAIDYWLGGKLDPFYFHIHIFLEYMLLCVLIYFMMKKMKPPYPPRGGAGGEPPFGGQGGFAMFATALFAFHTSNAETINYIIARSDEFSTLCIIAAFVIYLYNDGWKKHLALIPYIIGIFTKHSALMFAPILFVYVLLFENTPSSVVLRPPSLFIALKRTWLYFITGIILFIFTKSMFAKTWQPSDVSRYEYLITQPYIFLVYLKTFFLPTGLTADTDIFAFSTLKDFRIWAGIAAIILLLWLAYKFSKKKEHAPISFGILWFFIALIPSSSIIPLAEVMNHHRTFFPYIGLVISVSWGLYLILETFRVSKTWKVYSVYLLCIIPLLANAICTYERNKVWFDEVTLWADVTEKSPNNGRGLMNYGLALAGKGEHQRALSYYEKALKTRYVYHPYLYINIAIEKEELKQNEAAEQNYLLALKYGALYPACYYYYGTWLYRNNRQPEAISNLKKALGLSPGYKPAADYLDLINNYATNILTNAEQATKLHPSPENYLQLSLIYYNAGRYEDCITACNSALSLRKDYAEAYNNICSAYNMLKQWDKAIDACNKAIKLKPDYPLAKGNLNWAKGQKRIKTQ